MNEIIKSIENEYLKSDMPEINVGDTVKVNVRIVEGNKEKVDYNSLDVIEHVKLYTEDGISEKDAIKLVAKERNVAKSVIYNEYHNRK